MDSAITIEPIDSVSEETTVRHYDELSQVAQEQFPALASGTSGTACLDDQMTTEFDDGDVVVFTGYYRVRVV